MKLTRRKTYGFTKDKAERITRNTEEAYLSLSDKVNITREQLKQTGEMSLKAYAETESNNFDLEDFIEIVVTEGEIVNKQC
jgi:hypothetical protein